MTDITLDHYITTIAEELKPAFEKTIIVIKCMDELKLWDTVFEGVDNPETRLKWRSQYVCEELVKAGMTVELKK